MATIPNYRRSAYRGGTSYGENRRSYSDARTSRDRTGYVYGSLAHQLEEVPERRQRPQRHRRRKVYPQTRPVSMPSIGLSSFVFLLAAAAVTMAVCFFYLHMQSGITQMKNEVVSLQTEIIEMEQENDEAYQKIMDSVDLSEVYAIATGELGMIQSVDNQVYKYNNNKSDMVKQYGDIPSASK